MRILIASGIYPPDIGGPAQYARNLYETWSSSASTSRNATEQRGKASEDERVRNEVKVAAYRWERAFPPLVRHILYFLKIIRKGWKADLILVLDTWSAAVPAMYACKLMRKKYIVRTGGDFLWESYVERTGDLVLFRDFYSSRMGKLSRKEKLIFKLGGDSLRTAAAVIFSTDWQKDIFTKAYGLDAAKNHIVENYCGEREPSHEPENRMFVAGTRPLKWKNAEFLKECFIEAQDAVKKLNLPPIELDCGKAVYDSFVEKIGRSYAVILASLGDISPNMILDAVKEGTPFIVTRENGINHRIKDAAILIDPQNKKDIVDKIVWLADPQNRAVQAAKVRGLTFKHSWKEIATEIVDIYTTRIHE